MILKKIVVCIGLLTFVAPASAETTHDTFFENFSSLCGQAVIGAVVKDNRSDARFAGKKIILHVRDCSPSEIRMPMHVGDDHSRTFILRKVESGLEFRHDHRHEDGKPDDVTLYGGVTTANGSGGQQDFPADAKTKALFVENGLDVSVSNVWTVTITPETAVTYALNRPGREFKIKFDLNKTVDNPPAAWGHR
ncbi:MAG: hypothetical protein AB3N28_00835 [Kordiimonas sp.]